MDSASTYYRRGLMRQSLKFLRITLKIIAVYAIGTSPASALCEFASGETTHTYTFTIAPINVPRDATPGKVLYTTSQVAQPPQATYAACSQTDVLTKRVTGGSKVSNNPLTYATNVPGIGIRYFDVYSTDLNYWGEAEGPVYPGSYQWGGRSVGVEVVVTGPVGSGITNGAVAGVFTLGNLTVANLHVNGFQIIPTTCSTSALIPVAMPSVSASTLPAVGSTSGSTRFGIQLANCPVAVQEIAYQLDAPDGVVNAIDGVFLASTDSTSHGVGLAIKDSSNQPVSLNTRHPLPDFRPAAGAAYRIELSSNYYRTGDVEVGTVSGRLIYTMFYQ
jgi:major type 1 subunit fimbrin (pilin)